MRRNPNRLDRPGARGTTTANNHPKKYKLLTFHSSMPIQKHRYLLSIENTSSFGWSFGRKTQASLGIGLGVSIQTSAHQKMTRKFSSAISIRSQTHNVLAIPLKSKDYGIELNNPYSRELPHENHPHINRLQFIDFKHRAGRYRQHKYLWKAARGG